MLHEQLKRRPVPRSGTQNEPREKENEHTPTVNRQKCHCLAVEQREANSTGNSARKKKQNIVKRVNTEQAMEQTASMTNNTHLRVGENVACVLRATQQLTFDGEGRPAQQPSAAAAVPPRGTEPSPVENAHTIMSCKVLLQHSDLQQ